MKTKKASLLTKLVVLALLIGAATGLLNLRQQILTAHGHLNGQGQTEALFRRHGKGQRLALFYGFRCIGSQASQIGRNLESIS